MDFFSTMKPVESLERISIDAPNPKLFYLWTNNVLSKFPQAQINGFVKNPFGPALLLSYNTKSDTNNINKYHSRSSPRISA